MEAIAVKDKFCDKEIQINKVLGVVEHDNKLGNDFVCDWVQRSVCIYQTMH